MRSGYLAVMGRPDVSMSPAELAELLAGRRTGVLSTLGSDGWPHSAAMWFVHRSGAIEMWTYAKSQKAVNARRDGRCSFLVEEGSEYAALRGVMVRGSLEVVTGFDEVAAIGRRLYERYTRPVTGVAYEAGPGIEVERQAHKRVGLVLPMKRVASWDHSKVGR